MKALNPAMTVGVVAKRAGVNIDTIRYYERQGLLSKSARTRAGYRTFTEETIQRLRFIKNAKALGFTLGEIKQLLVLRVTAGSACTAVRRQAQAKVSHIEEKITSLENMKEALQKLITVCLADKPTAKCSFLTNLNSEGISS